MSQANIPELRLTLIDGFCGGGSYQTEEGSLTDGSPLLMMRAVREARALLNLDRRIQRKIDVHYSFIDILPDTTKHLRHWLDARRQENAIDLTDYEQTQIFNNDFLQELPSIINKVKQRKMGEHAIFILDQYCYKDIPLPEISALMRTLKGAEVVMTFNVDNLVTYISENAANRKAVENIGLDKYIPWSEIKTLKSTQKREWRKVLQRHLAHGIKTETGVKFMTLFL